MRTDHKEAMRRLNDEHEQLMNNTVAEHQQEILDRTEASDAKIGSGITFLSLFLMHVDMKLCL